MKQALDQWDIMRSPTQEVMEFYKAGPAGIPTQQAFSQSTRWPTLDADRQNGCIRSLEHAFSQQGGLAVLYGNIAEDGCVVKTAGVDDSILVFEGNAHVTESQDEAVQANSGTVAVREVDRPSGPGVRVRVRAAGICGSDLHLVNDGIVGESTTLGHEIAGLTDDGTPVAVEPIDPCDRCDPCRRGERPAGLPIQRLLR